ncbi:MAG: hypothetical protein KBT02_05255 [Treponema sp.]|nr:hypothetical protein [Candidatus Treponema caballi]
MKKNVLLSLIILLAVLILTGCAEASIYDGTWISTDARGKIVIKGDTIKTYDTTSDLLPSAKGKIEISDTSFAYDGLIGTLSADGTTLKMEIEGYEMFSMLFTKQ